MPFKIVAAALAVAVFKLYGFHFALYPNKKIEGGGKY